MSTIKPNYTRPLDFKQGRVDMTHGSGGRAMAQLIDELFIAAFDNEFLRQMNDQARFTVSAGRLVMSPDSHVVPRPLYLSASFILEEGFPLAGLKRIVESMAQAARDARGTIVTGDTKVVEQGKGDGVFITTTGIGVLPEGG